MAETVINPSGGTAAFLERKIKLDKVISPDSVEQKEGTNRPIFGIG